MTLPNKFQIMRANRRLRAQAFELAEFREVKEAFEHPDSELMVEALRMIERREKSLNHPRPLPTKRLWWWPWGRIPRFR